MMPMSFRTHTYEVTAEGTPNRAARVATWLLERGARVVVRDTGLRAVVTQQLQQVAADGRSYAAMLARLIPSAAGAVPADEQRLFAAAYRGQAVVSSDATVCHWIQHLIDRSVRCHPDDSPLSLLRRPSASVVLLLDDPASYEHARRFVRVVADGEQYRIMHPKGTWSTRDAVTHEAGWLVAHTERAPARVVPLAALAEHSDRISAISAAVLATRAAGTPYARIGSRIPEVPAREHDRRVVQETARLRVIDDAAATDPIAAAATLTAFGGPTTVLIAGGDGSGDWTTWAHAVRAGVRATNLILVDGSATTRMRRALGPWGRGIRSYASLDRAYAAALGRAGKYLSATLLFSPAAAFAPPDAFVRRVRRD